MTSVSTSNWELLRLNTKSFLLQHRNSYDDDRGGSGGGGGGGGGADDDAGGDWRDDGVDVLRAAATNSLLRELR